MGVVTVTLPTSDTKKVLVVLLHVPVQRIEIVRRKRTEGAQQSLLCVHTSNVGIHPWFRLFRGNVTVATPVFNCLPPETDVDGLFHDGLPLFNSSHIHRLLLVFLNWGCSWGGCGVGLHILKKLRQFPHTHLRTRPLKGHPPLCDHLMASGYCTNCCKWQKYMYFNIFDVFDKRTIYWIKFHTLYLRRLRHEFI